MGKMTKHLPKPMLAVKGSPIIAHIIRNLVRQDITELTINLHFMSDCIKDFLGDGSKFGAQINYFYEETLLGGAGTVRALSENFKDGDFLVHYGDIITSQEILPVCECHKKNAAIATILVHERKDSNSIAVLDSENRIVNFLERPSDEQRRGIASQWAFSGIGIFSPEVIKHISKSTPCDFPKDIFPVLARSKSLYAFGLTGNRIAIDSPERILEANKLEWITS